MATATQYLTTLSLSSLPLSLENTGFLTMMLKLDSHIHKIETGSPSLPLPKNNLNMDFKKKPTIKMQSCGTQTQRIHLPQSPAPTAWGSL